MKVAAETLQPMGREGVEDEGVLTYCLTPKWAKTLPTKQTNLCGIQHHFLKIVFFHVEHLLNFYWRLHLKNTDSFSAYD